MAYHDPEHVISLKAEDCGLWL